MKAINFALFAAFAASTVLAAPALAEEPDWQRVSEAGDGSGEHYVDANSIKRKGDVVSFTQRTKLIDDADGWDTVLAETQVNCKTSQHHPIRLIVTMTNGKRESFDNPNPNDWSDIKPESVGSDVQNFVCKK